MLWRVASILEVDNGYEPVNVGVYKAPSKPGCTSTLIFLIISSYVMFVIFAFNPILNIHDNNVITLPTGISGINLLK